MIAFKKLYRNISNPKITDKILKVTTKISPKLTREILYYYTFEKRINWKNPTEFNEKLMCIQTYNYDKNPLIAKCSDKYTVRKYVEDCGLPQILTRLIGVYDSTSQIEWGELPQSFVFKVSNSCGANLICRDKDKISKEDVFKFLNSDKHKDYGIAGAEIQYSQSESKIICEELIDNDGKLPIDYKLWCFNGEVEIIMACYDRGANTKLYFMDRNWKRVYIDTANNPDEYIGSKPKDLDLMIEYAEILSKPFQAVRVDMYQTKNGPVLGEMTFTSAGNLMQYITEEGRYMLGSKLNVKYPYH